MKIVKYAFLLVLVCAMSATGATVTFRSGDGLNEWNDAPAHTNVLVTYNPVWATDTLLGAQWISFMDTGKSATFLPNSTVHPIARFSEQFELPSEDGPYSGYLNVWADDTAAVYINGKLIQAPNFVLGEHCTAASIGCISAAGGGFSLGFPELQYGMNLLEIDVYQLGGDSSGAMYSASLVAMPEPGTLMLLGMGLGALGVVRFRRR